MRNKIKKNENFWGYAFILLPLTGTFLLYYYPLSLSLFNSFFKWNVIKPREFIGLKNYFTILFEDEQIVKSFLATGRYLFFHVPLVMGVGLFFAVFLNNQRLIGKNIFRTIIIIPWVTSSVAIGVVWLFIFNPNVGLLNSILGSLFGAEKLKWFTNPKLAMGMLLTVSVWRGMGYSFIFFISGLQTIPVQLYESAMLDGAKAYQSFFHITLPLLSPYIFMVFLLVMTGASQEFELPLILTGGKPDYSTQLINLAIYKEAFLYMRMGYASAVASLAYLFVLALASVQIIFQRKWVFYQDQ